MNILIRTDLSVEMGMGHAVRCKALAQELTSRGARIRFVSNTPESLAPFVAPWACTHVATVAVWWGRVDVVIVDTKYPIEEMWYQRFEEALGGKVVRIDHPQATPETCALSIAPVAHWPADTVTRLQQTFGDRFLYGWDYIMLAPEVTHQPPIPYGQRTQGPIVFCAGGSNERALRQMWDWTRDLDLPAQAHFVFGEMMDRWEPAPGRQMKTYLYAPRTYHERLRQASLVVGMFGVTTYECLYYHTPMVVLAHTDENTRDARALQEASSQQIRAIGRLEDMDRDQFCEIVSLIYHATIRKTTEGKPWRDGLGIQRVAAAILAL